MKELENLTQIEDKKELYRMMNQQLKSLMEEERHWVSNLANASALLMQTLTQINWAGFYLMTEGSLLLGPFQGKTACIRIPVGRGVCGTAAAKAKTMVVGDVHEFPGHIACDGASNAEIVVPMIVEGAVKGVLDIDSPVLGRFDEEDQVGLEAFVKILELGCDW